MKIIIPMAGMGKRMRPHTLTMPKPLLPVAGKPIVQRLVEEIAEVCNEKITEIAFVTGRFGIEAEAKLKTIASAVGAEGKIYYQDEALGTAHAILCAGGALDGKTVVAFADTLFKADFKMDTQAEGVIWVQKIEDPRQFGVVKVNEQNTITDFVEKPQQFISDLAIIGIYYFRDGAYLKKELQFLIDNNIKDKGEYQLTNALENMKKKGTKFVPGKISEWLDCGNKDATVYTNQRVLEFKKSTEKLVAASAQNKNSTIIPPCFIGENTVIENSTIGPHVSLGKNCNVSGSTIKNSIVQENAEIGASIIRNSMIGNYAIVNGFSGELSISDYSVVNK